MMRSVALVLIVVLTSGCSTWRPVNGGPPAATASAPESASARPLPDRVRVLLRDGSQVLLDHPAVVGDSLHGDVADAGVRSIALTDILAIESRKFHFGTTVGLLLLIGTVGAVIALLAATQVESW